MSGHHPWLACLPQNSSDYSGECSVPSLPMNSSLKRTVNALWWHLRVFSPNLDSCSSWDGFEYFSCSWSPDQCQFHESLASVKINFSDIFISCHEVCSLRQRNNRCYNNIIILKISSSSHWIANIMIGWWFCWSWGAVVTRESWGISSILETMTWVTG